MIVVVREAVSNVGGNVDCAAVEDGFPLAGT
jgi:hypothetical protein